MSVRFATSRSAHAGRPGETVKRRGGVSCISEKQTQAYLVARDTLRRIRRISAVVLPPSGRNANPE